MWTFFADKSIDLLELNAIWLEVKQMPTLQWKSLTEKSSERDTKHVPWHHLSQFKENEMERCIELFCYIPSAIRINMNTSLHIKRVLMSKFSIFECDVFLARLHKIPFSSGAPWCWPGARWCRLMLSGEKCLTYQGVQLYNRNFSKS